MGIGLYFVIVNTERNANRVRPHSSLAAWRKLKGWGQREAAEYLGISQAYYYKLEQHEAAPRPTIAKRVTERTGVPLDELMGIAS